jgi:hypothetical protein
MSNLAFNQYKPACYREIIRHALRTRYIADLFIHEFLRIKHFVFYNSNAEV